MIDDEKARPLENHEILGTRTQSLLEEAHKFLHIVFGSVPGAHPAHHGLLNVPGIEEVPLQHLGDRVARNSCEDSICLNRLHDLHLRHRAQFPPEQLRHAV